ncbi:pantoate--beta-alanine ligase [Corynebacterium pseudotuberculosis]|uniref:pantoate--beta-alanine ligase n=1 Tax=Corynebacterium pseudotuberculosis TaxID=1719 RepID=UPI0002FE1FFF|nr:pantoate--beta-alanine ligase [Corynebacterium pseudotuberculosis]AFM08083.2 pantoate--beta-alanine ligase [Corynebacterium pseudotuberculosis Cp162]APG82487.1 pantothenate synthetase [Corynebacterium pseudotuberculosis]WFP66906.1 pantoate--beta-alanine ligase [Corynebacterium pseudotuberculosis]
MFQFGQAQVFDDIAMLSRAFKKQGKPVVMVSISTQVHAGHVALLRTARRIPGAVVVVVARENQPTFAAERVDAVYIDRDEPARTLIDANPRLTRRIALLNLVGPTDVIYGEDDYAFLLHTQRAITDLRIPVKVHSVPTVRMPDGIAISSHNSLIPTEDREKALALSAAVTAGALRGVEAAKQVLAAAGVEPDYVRCEDNRVYVAATFGGVQLIDSASDLNQE